MAVGIKDLLNLSVLQRSEILFQNRIYNFLYELNTVTYSSFVLNSQFNYEYNILPVILNWQAKKTARNIMLFIHSDMRTYYLSRRQRVQEFSLQIVTRMLLRI